MTSNKKDETKNKETKSTTAQPSTFHFPPSTCKISLEILTGRTHQIRYHLAHHGLPIIGDYLYGNAEETTPMQLTAYKLVFRDPEGELMTIEI